MSKALHPVHDDARLDHLAQTFGLSFFAVIFQELSTTLLGRAADFLKWSFGFSTRDSSSGNPEDDTLISYAGIFWLDALLPFLFYPCSRLLATSFTPLMNGVGLPITAETYSLLFYLVFLRGHIRAAFAGVASLSSWDEASWDRLPFDRLILSIYNIWGFVYQSFWFYQLHISGNALNIYVWMEHLASLLLTKRFLVLLLLSEVTVRFVRKALGLTLNEALWKGFLLITPLEAFSLMDAYERNACSMMVVIWTSEKVILLWTAIRRCLQPMQTIKAGDAAGVTVAQFAFNGFTDGSTELRLLRLDPQADTSNPSYTLTAFPIAQAPSYEAMSYTWGGQKPEVQITINRCRFLVTRNARAIILDRLARPRERWLWIDSVCVNQNDNDEKSLQVAIMGSIYQGAALVTIWLDTTPKPTISDAFLATSLLYIIQQRRVYKQRHRIRNNTCMGNSRMWQALRNLITHTYWLRLWIIQEVALAKRIQIVYGGLRISGEILIKLVADDIVHYREVISTGMALGAGDPDERLLAALQISRIHQCTKLVRGSIDMSLTEVLSTTIQAGTKDPRDKMFGFYSVIRFAKPSEKLLGEVKPDYGKSTADVYNAVTKALLLDDPGFVFNRAGIGYATRSPALPTYIIDWSEEGIWREKLKVQHESSVPSAFRYRAGGSDGFAYKFDRWGKMVIRGTPIGQIGSMTETLRPNGYRLYEPEYEGPVDSQARDKFYEQLAMYCGEMMAIRSKMKESSRFSREDHFNVIGQTLVGGRISGVHKTDSKRPKAGDSEGSRMRHAPKDLGPLYCGWQLWGLWAEGLREDYIKMSTLSARIREDLSSKGPNPSRHLIRSGTEFQRMLEGTSNQGHFAITDNGHTAIVPLRAKPDDAIFVVPGLPKPLVLRRRGTNDPVHQFSSNGTTPNTGQTGDWVLVGDCYVYDFVDGQALEGSPEFYDLAIV